MNALNQALPIKLTVLAMLFAFPGCAQTNAQKAEKRGARSAETEAREKNTEEYIKLLRSDVRQQKAEIMGAVMLLSATDAAKFWPVYEDYDAQLNKLNDQRVENIRDYARTYSQLTDSKADELIQNALAYQKQRAELLAKAYDRVKQTLGAITAARFVQVEHQLLSLIDLQISSSLPVVGPGG